MGFADWLVNLVSNNEGLYNFGKGLNDFGSQVANSAAVAGQTTSNPYVATPYTAPVTNPPDTTEGFGGDGIVDGSGESDSLDPSGYDQAAWELEKQRELLAEQRAYNSAEAEKTREWQERMSNTAYQRAVTDLEKSGLNKWLAVTGGNGASASTPSGASASSQAGDVSTPNPKIYIQMLQFLQAVMTSSMKQFSSLLGLLK